MTPTDEMKAAVERLEPCPFCGASGEDLGICRDGPDLTKPDRAIRCYGCGIEAPFYDTEAEAIAAWNTRSNHLPRPVDEDRGGDEVLRPVDPRSLQLSINELTAWDKAGTPLDKIKNWVSFGESVSCCLHELKWLRAQDTRPTPSGDGLVEALRPFAALYNQITRDHGADWFADEGQVMRAALAYPVANSAVVWRHFRLAAEALPEPAPCFACGGSGDERRVGYGGVEEVVSCSVCQTQTVPCPPSLTDAPRWRAEVVAFADLMEAQLRANDHKPGWKRDHPEDLLYRLRQEADELAEEIGPGSRSGFCEWSSRIGKEAADVANFAMMIADVCQALAHHAPVCRDSEEGGWRPIATAPRDGSDILVFHKIHGPISARFDQGEWSEETPISPREYSGSVWVLGDDIDQEEVEELQSGEYFDGNVTHWMPAIPSPKNPDHGEEGGEA